MKLRFVHGCLGGIMLLGWFSCVSAQTYYRDSPGASDASKIATEMLNDAASGRFRNQNFSRPYNPFDRMIEDYENSKRARAAELERWQAEYERTRGQREAEERYQQQVMQENARRRAEAQARQQRAAELRGRVEELREQANLSDPAAHLELGILVQEGKYEPGVLTFPPGMTPMAWVKQRYDQAQTLGSETAVVAVGSLAEAESPSFAVLWNTVHSLGTPEAKRDHLRTLADRGHLGANLWLGGWYSGRRVGLGLPPTGERGPESRRLALRYLDRARKQNFLHAGTWYAETLLSGTPTEAERVEAMEVLEGLLAPGSQRDLAAAPALAKELLSHARVEADLVRPRALLAELERLPYVTGLAAVGGVYALGLDGEFHPGLAARAYGRIPWVGERASYQVSEELWAGIDAWLGVDSKRDPRAALERFRKARMLAGLIRGGVLPQHRLLKVEVELWLAFALAELGEGDPKIPDPLRHLKDQTRDDQRLGHLLSACAELGDRRTPATVAGNIWMSLNLQAPLTSPLPPVETWLVLQCALRCHQRGGLSELAPWVEAIQALAPRDVPIRGPALLARLYFTRAHPRDVAERAGISGVYAAMVRAAWRDPELWRHVAALVEVLQVEPLSRKQWTAGWLAPFLEKNGAASEDQKRWAEQLIQPTVEGDKALERLAARHSGPREEDLPDLQALNASVQLRFAVRNDQARSMFERMVALGKAGSWHAQAMLEDFPVRYRRTYARRNDLKGFRRDAREAAELVADWRERGAAFVIPDSELRMQAIGTAIVFGSTRFSREVLKESAKGHNRAAEVALLKLEAFDADPRSDSQQDDDELAGLLWERSCQRTGFNPEEGSIPMRLERIAGELARESGKDAAIAFLWRQGTRHPGIRWRIAEGYAQGLDFFAVDPAAALDAFRRASGPGGVRPRFSTLMTWVETASGQGKPQDFEALDLWIRDSAFSIKRWRDPDEPGFSVKLNPPLEAVERLAAASLARGSVNLNSPTPEELARSLRLHLLAVGLGSSAALHRLESAPFSTMPGTQGALARVLSEASTLNAPIAIGFLRQAAAGGDAVAKHELTQWIHPSTAKPTPRLERILKRRQELQDPADRVHLDPVRSAAGGDGLDLGWLTLEQAFLVRAAKKGDSQARSILVESGLMLPGLVDVTPDEWVQRARRGLIADDPAALWIAVSEAPDLWKLARLYWIEGQEPWRKAARTIGEVAVRLNRPEIAPGHSRQELIPLLDIGLLAGHGPSFVNLIQVEWDGIRTADPEERTRKRDGVVLDLTARLLSRDPGNAVFLEKTARPLVKEGARWNELLRAWLLYADAAGTPTPLLLFARENAEREIRLGTTLQGEGVDSAFLPIERRHLYGYTGYFLLKRAGAEKDPLAARVLATLGYTANDGPELLNR